MATVTLELGAKRVVLSDPDIDDNMPWGIVLRDLLIPALAAHGYQVDDLYHIEELRSSWEW